MRLSCYLLLFFIISCETNKKPEVWDDPVVGSAGSEKNAPLGQVEPEVEVKSIDVVDEPWKVQKEIAAKPEDKDLVFESDSIKEGPKQKIKTIDSEFSEDVGVQQKGLVGRKNTVRIMTVVVNNTVVFDSPTSTSKQIRVLPKDTKIKVIKDIDAKWIQINKNEYILKENLK